MERTDKVGLEVLRQISILDAIYWINGSWKQVEPSTIQKCFAKCGFPFAVSEQCDKVVSDSDCDDDDDEIPLQTLRLSHELFSCEYQELVELDRLLPTCDLNNCEIRWDNHAQDILTDLKSACDRDDNGDDDDCNDEHETVTEDVISMAEANDMLCKLKTLALSRGQDKWLIIS